MDSKLKATMMDRAGELEMPERRVAERRATPIFTDTDVRMLYVVSHHMAKDDSPKCADDLQNLANRIQQMMTNKISMPTAPMTDAEIDRAWNAAPASKKDVRDPKQIVDTWMYGHNIKLSGAAYNDLRDIIKDLK